MEEIFQLMGQPFQEVFQLSSLLIFNFGEKIKYSLHVDCFVRVWKGDQIILVASSDEYFDMDGNILEHPLGKDSSDDRLYNKESLLTKHIEGVNRLLQGRYVRQVKYVNGDITIIFDDNIQIQVLIDCSTSPYECYRLIEYFPNYDEKSSSKHIVVYCKNGMISEEEE